MELKGRSVKAFTEQYVFHDVCYVMCFQKHKQNTPLELKKEGNRSLNYNVVE